MTPVHKGLPEKSLYSTSNFRWYSVCLDSGRSATDACEKDIRKYLLGSDRVQSAYAYKGDGPSGSCDDHVLVDWCVTGGGVATSYCSKFPDVEIASRALVKMTSTEVEEIKAAAKNGLTSAYTDDRYVYYVSGSGSDLDWHGFSGNANDGISAPYVVCPKHDQKAWEQYEEEQRAEQEEQEQENQQTPAVPPQG